MLECRREAFSIYLGQLNESWIYSGHSDRDTANSLRAGVSKLYRERQKTKGERERGYKIHVTLRRRLEEERSAHVQFYIGTTKVLRVRLKHVASRDIGCVVRGKRDFFFVFIALSNIYVEFDISYKGAQ